MLYFLPFIIRFGTRAKNVGFCFSEPWNFHFSCSLSNSIRLMPVNFWIFSTQNFFFSVYILCGRWSDILGGKATFSVAKRHSRRQRDIYANKAQATADTPNFMRTYALHLFPCIRAEGAARPIRRGADKKLFTPIVLHFPQFVYMDDVKHVDE